MEPRYNEAKGLEKCIRYNGGSLYRVLFHTFYYWRKSFVIPGRRYLGVRYFEVPQYKEDFGGFPTNSL